jgi:hypothetical protein
MGMDVFGKEPTSKAGEYFRNNVWWWRPLADYAREIATVITGRCEHWQTNDGDGLNAADAVALADALQAEIDSGRTEAYPAIREAELAVLPNGECGWPDATGIRDGSKCMAATAPAASDSGPLTIHSPSRTCRSLSTSCATAAGSRFANRGDASNDCNGRSPRGAQGHARCGACTAQAHRHREE